MRATEAAAVPPPPPSPLLPTATEIAKLNPVSVIKAPPAADVILGLGAAESPKNQIGGPSAGKKGNAMWSFEKSLAHLNPGGDPPLFFGKLGSERCGRGQRSA